MSNIFFTSDTHFFHNNVIIYCNRPFETREQMNEVLIQEWNSVVGENDVVYHIGDFAFASRTDNEYILSRLNGSKILVAGNHDDKRVRKAIGWEFVCNEILLEYGGFNIRCNHFPSWKDNDDYDIYLHGHCHASLPPTPRVMDVGVDMAYRILGSYRPFSMSEIADELIRIDSLFGTPSERMGEE